MLRAFLFVLFLTSFAYGQSKENYVEYYKETGELTSDDQAKDNFGRYDGYQMPFRSGETVNLIVYSENFTPSIVLVTPDNNVYRQVRNDDRNYVTLQVEIPKEGTWIVYVIGAMEAEGDYLFHYGFASPGAMIYNKNFSFCESLKFLQMHARASFVFLQSIPGRELPVIKGGKESYINGDDASYNALLFSGSSKEAASEKYDEFIQKLKECLGSGWQTDSKDWTSLQDQKMKYFVLNKKQGNDISYVRVSFSDYTELEGEYHDDYVVEMTINNFVSEEN